MVDLLGCDAVLLASKKRKISSRVKDCWTFEDGTSVTTNKRCVTSQKNEELICTAAEY
jgi:hypothetical protein